MSADLSPRAARYLRMLLVVLLCLAAWAWMLVDDALYDSWLKGWIRGVKSVQCIAPLPPPDVLPEMWLGPPMGPPPDLAK